MMVAQPLVGVTSDCEYMKVGFDGDYSEQELVDTINNAFPPDIKILAQKVEVKLTLKNLTERYIRLNLNMRQCGY